MFQDIPDASDELVTKHFLFWLALKTATSVRSVAGDAIYITYCESKSEEESHSYLGILDITPDDLKSYITSEIMFRRDNSVSSILSPLGFKNSFNTTDFAEIFPDFVSTYGNRKVQIVLMPGDVMDKWKYKEVEDLVEKKLDVKFNDKDSISLNVPLPFEMGVSVESIEADKFDKDKLRINPENDGKYLPLYRGYVEFHIKLTLRKD